MQYWPPCGIEQIDQEPKLGQEIDEFLFRLKIQGAFLFNFEDAK